MENYKPANYNVAEDNVFGEAARRVIDDTARTACRPLCQAGLEVQLTR